MRPAHFLRLLIVAWVMSISFSKPVFAELVDRILAVVNDEIISLSDLQKYRAFFGQSRDSETVLEELIDQKLLLAEARKFEIPSPSDEIVEEEVKALIVRFGGKTALIDRLKRLIFSEEELRDVIRIRLIAAQLLAQRINIFVFVSPQEVQAHYEAHPEQFAGQTLEEARSTIQDHLTQGKIAGKRGDYLNRLRGRSTIRIN